MNRNQRVIWSDNGTIKDLSLVLGDYRSDAIVFPFATAQDYLYIGSELPFNTRYFDLGTVNTEAATASVSLWNGSAWVPTKDVLDGTRVGASGTASLGKSGEVTYAQDIDNAGWQCVRISSEVTGLTATSVFNMYWTRWHWSADLLAGTSLNYVGLLFSDDDDLYGSYPDLQNAGLKDAYETGKSDWREQAFNASESIVREMRRRNIIATRDQIFDTSLLLDANVHKTAEIIYGGLGSAYAEAKKAAAIEYGKALDLKFFQVDKDGSGTLDPSEKRSSMGFMTR
jgi:hypothetical protein